VEASQNGHLSAASQRRNPAKSEVESAVLQRRFGAVTAAKDREIGQIRPDLSASAAK